MVRELAPRFAALPAAAAHTPLTATALTTSLTIGKRRVLGHAQVKDPIACGQCSVSGETELCIDAAMGKREAKGGGDVDVAVKGKAVCLTGNL